MEFRNNNVIASVLLYALSTVFVVYMANQEISKDSWISLFFIIILFIVLNALTRSFLQEGQNRFLLYYQLIPPTQLIIAKLLYNTSLVFVISLITLLLYNVVSGSIMELNNVNFILAFVLGVVGLSSCITFISGIAVKTNNSAGLLSILSLPLLIPVIMLTINLAEKGLKGHTQLGKEWMSLLAIDVLIVTLSLILFPYLWKE